MRKLCLFTAIFILTIFVSGNIYANTAYTIKKGDNPSKIAKKFKVSVQNIIKANNLRPKNLKPGTKITIPSNKSEISRGEKESSNGTKSNPPSPPLSKKEKGGFSGESIKPVKHQEDSQFHKENKGDTLLSLS